MNISELRLLNIGKTPNLDVHLLRTASSRLDDLYKEAEEIGKHHTRTLYETALSWFYYAICIIIGLVALYITVKWSLISKCISIIKYCFIPKGGCAKYFNNCFNNNVNIQERFSLNELQHMVTFHARNQSSPSLSENTSNNEIEMQRENRRKNCSRSRNNRLYELGANI